MYRIDSCGAFSDRMLTRGAQAAQSKARKAVEAEEKKRSGL